MPARELNKRSKVKKKSLAGHASTTTTSADHVDHVRC